MYFTIPAPNVSIWIVFVNVQKRYLIHCHIFKSFFFSVNVVKSITIRVAQLHPGSEIRLGIQIKTEMYSLCVRLWCEYDCVWFTFPSLFNKSETTKTTASFWSFLSWMELSIPSYRFFFTCFRFRATISSSTETTRGPSSSTPRASSVLQNSGRS